MSGLVIAHLGGIDEIAMFVLPALAVVFLLRRAERRARERAEGEADPNQEPKAAIR